MSATQFSATLRHVAEIRNRVPVVKETAVRIGCAWDTSQGRFVLEVRDPFDGTVLWSTLTESMPPYGEAKALQRLFRSLIPTQEDSVHCVELDQQGVSRLRALLRLMDIQPPPMFWETVLATRLDRGACSIVVRP